MKRFLAILMAVMLLLTGCGGDKPSPAPSVEEPVQPEIVVQNKLLTEFLDGIPADTAQLAVAYLGYADLTGYEDLTVYLESNGFYELYPFLNEMTQEQFVQREGGELYLVVPTSQETVLTVFDCAVDETAYELERGEELLTLEAGQPVLLQGNVSEIVPNLWVQAQKDGEAVLDYVLCLSLMDGTLVQENGVYDCSDYDHVLAIWSGDVEEIPAFCNTWHTQTTDGEGLLRQLKLVLWPDGFVEYRYGLPGGSVLEAFEGYWYETDGVLTLDMHGGPAEEETGIDPEFAYDSVCTFEWDYQSRHLTLRHTDGGVLLYGTEGVAFDFMPFDYYTLAGVWSAAAPYWGWDYDLSLLENGECQFTVSEAGEELVLYEGWWSTTDDSYVILDMGLSSGQHPESPEMEQVGGWYLAEKAGNTLKLTYSSGSILTVGMEENGDDSFTLSSGPFCVSVHDVADIAMNRDAYDWVIVDDTLPLEAVFCTTVPVEEFTVVSLFLQGDGSELNFDVTELYEYGTLTPEQPFGVVLTSYGTIPSYGVSFTDPNGDYRLFGVNVSGLDGSLELTEIP